MKRLLACLLLAAAPLPGAQGITELMYCRVFSHVFSQACLMPSLYVTRGSSFYFVLVVSLLVVLLNEAVRRRGETVKDRQCLRAAGHRYPL